MWSGRVHECYPTTQSWCIHTRTHTSTLWYIPQQWVCVLKHKGAIAKVHRSPVKRTKFVWEGGRFFKRHTWGFKLPFCIHIGLTVEPWSANFRSFQGEGGVSSETNSVRFAGALWSFAMAPVKSLSFSIQPFSATALLITSTHLLSFSVQFLSWVFFFFFLQAKGPSLDDLASQVGMVRNNPCFFLFLERE